jgi:DNA-binding transcriptional MerR regulator
MIPFRSSKSRTSQEFTVDELARAAETTVRNVRAYQDRGLLAPPAKRGRVGIYNQDHLERLRLIGQLLGRGYTLGNIQELIKAVESGHDIRQLLGLMSAIASPWSTQKPKHYNLAQLALLFGGKVHKPVLETALKLGLLEADGIGYKSNNPNILQLGVEITKAGLPLGRLLELFMEVRTDLSRLTDKAVSLFVEVLDKYGDGLPPAEDMQKLAKLLWKIRPLVMSALELEISRALEGSINKFVDDRLARVLAHLVESAPREADLAQWSLGIQQDVAADEKTNKPANEPAGNQAGAGIDSSSANPSSK